MNINEFLPRIETSVFRLSNLRIYKAGSRGQLKERNRKALARTAHLSFLSTLTASLRTTAIFPKSCHYKHRSSCSALGRLTPKPFKKINNLKLEFLLWSLNDTLGGFHRERETVLIFPMDFLGSPGGRCWLTVLAGFGDDPGLTVVTHSG